MLGFKAISNHSVPERQRQRGEVFSSCCFRGSLLKKPSFLCSIGKVSRKQEEEEEEEDTCSSVLVGLQAPMLLQVKAYTFSEAVTLLV